MTLEDQPNLPPIDLNSQEAVGDDTDTDEESNESVDGFDFHSSEDEIEEYMVEHYMNEQDSEDIQREHADLQQRYAVMVAEDQARKAELDEMKHNWLQYHAKTTERVLPICPCSYEMPVRNAHSHGYVFK